ncbi:14728_t:CDS:2, partial [Entrophospora sp. SA101]
MTQTTQDQQNELQNNSSTSTSTSNVEFAPNNNNELPITITAASSSSSSTITLIAQHSTQPEISNLVYNAIIANDIYGLGRILRENPDYDINTLITNEITADENNRKGKNVYLTPLMISCTLNYVDITRYLLKKEKIGIDLQDKNGRSALFHATHNGNSEIVKLLLQYKVNVNITDKHEMSPLLVAATYGHTSISRMLLEGGFQIDVDYQDETGKTALALACYQGHTSTVEVLIKNGANVNIVDKSGWTALMSSAFFGRTNICYRLLESGADKTIREAKNHKNASDLAIDGGFPHLASMINNYTLISNNKLSHKSPNVVTSISSINSILVSRNNNFDNIERGVDENDISSNFHYDKDSKRVSFFANGNRRSKRYSSQNIHSISSLNRQNDQDDLIVTRLQSNNNYRDSLDYKSIAESMKHNSRTISAGERLRDEMKPRKEGTIWSFITLILTFYIPDYLLIRFGKLASEASRQAWKEKVATCLIIIMAVVATALLTINLSFEFCNTPIPIPKDMIQNSWSATGSDSHRVMIVRGKIYGVGDYFNMDLHRPVSPPQTNATLTPFIQSFYGQDATKFFPLDGASIGCNYSPVINNLCGFSDSELNDGKFHCHSSKKSLDSLKALYTNLHVSVPWDEIKNAANNITNNKYILYDSLVYNLTDYLSDNNNNLWLGKDDNSKTRYKSLLNSIANKDATLAINRQTEFTEILPCLEHFNIGRLEGVSSNCVLYSLSTIFYVGLFMSLGSIKIISSVIYNFIITKRMIKTDDSKPVKNLIVMVPCYSESSEAISSALKSLAVADYPDQNKLLFIIVDGKNIIGKQNNKPTSEIVKDLLDLREDKKFQNKKESTIPEEGEMEENEPQPLSYTSIAKEKGNVTAHNMAQIYSGYYRYEDRSVPAILVVKCGTPEEREANKNLQNDRSGNRGKRDSQLILFNLLRVSFNNSPMTKLDFELFEKIRSITNGLTVDDYELMTMIDADTIVDENSLKYLKNYIDNDDDVIGICGEAQIANKTASFVTMIQVFEYYMSYNMGKPFECLFLNSLCLPGCFAMYRIYAKNKHNSELRVPIIIDDYVFTNYFSDENDTLHQKNLILGEDRYLTTLVVRSFPRRRIVYCTDATCQTIVPETFSVLLSQRRRWINGTIHNQLTLLASPGLPGRFCFSVQFVMLMELFVVATLPFSLIYFFVYFLQILLAANPNPLAIITSITVYMMSGIVSLFRLSSIMSLGSIKIISSVIYNFIITKRMIKTDDSKPVKNLIVMVPCYSESSEAISSALKSLAVADYPDQNKLLFIIVDGKNIIGKQNNKPTSEIVKDLLDLREDKKFQNKKESTIPEEGEMEENEPQPLSYTSIAKEKGNVTAHNMAQIYSGYYRYEDRSVPAILVVKCGTPEEREANKNLQNDRSGNRGKRDSQLILFNLLRVSFNNSPMTKLDFELFEKIRSITNGLTVDDYELMTMIDADTIVDENSLKYLKNYIDNDDDVIGICGEAQIANKTASFVTMIQ